MGSPCKQVSLERVFNIKVKAEAGGELSKKFWTSIEQKWLCKEDVALIKALLKEYMFAGQTTILQERWLGSHVLLYRSKDLGDKRRGLLLLALGFLKVVVLVLDLGLVGGVRA